MPATATLNGNRQQVIPDIEVAEEDKPKRGNPMMRKLEPEMLRNPYPIDLPSGKSIDSDQLCYSRCASFIFEPVGLKSEKECIEFAKNVWKWMGAAESRRREELAEELIAKAAVDPKLLEILKAKLEEV